MLYLYIHNDLRYTDQEFERVFTPGPMGSFHSARKKRVFGSFKCEDRCSQVCLNVVETERFASTFTYQIYKINHEFNCNDISLIYLLT